MVAEYRLTSEDPAAVSIMEADNAAVIFRALAEWDDVLEARVFPAVTAEEGMALARLRLASAQA